MRWLLLLMTTSLFAFTLKDSLVKGSPGDFVVFEQNKLITLLAIHSLSDTSLIIEEISLPSHLKPKDWHSFAKNKAPHATSHLLYEISLSSGEIIECYSCTKKTFLPPPSFLRELLFIALTPPVAPKKIGTEPPEGTPDRRPLWAPPVILEGVKKRATDFSIFTGLWPSDGSELSGEALTLYFMKELPFPIYIEVNDPHYTYKLFSINTGKHLPSPYPTMPRRPPSFIGGLIRSPTLYTFKLSSPSYYHSYTLQALDHETGETFSITPTLTRQNEIVTLSFPVAQLEKNRTYTFLAIPDEFPNYYAESQTTKL